jgi:hypothetical protein
VFDGRRWWNVIEDALATVALDDLIVGAHLLEHVRPETHVAQRAQAIARGQAECDARAARATLLEQGRQARLEILESARPRGSVAVPARLRRCVSSRRAPSSPDRFAFCCVASAAFRLLDVGGQAVGVDHPLDHLLLDTSSSVLRRLDLVAERLILAIGLDRGLLILELREARPGRARLPFPGARRASWIVGEALLRASTCALASFSRASASARRCGCAAIVCRASAIWLSSCCSLTRRSRSGNMVK